VAWQLLDLGAAESGFEEKGGHTNFTSGGGGRKKTKVLNRLIQ
jgi:hypothetical protein